MNGGGTPQSQGRVVMNGGGSPASQGGGATSARITPDIVQWIVTDEKVGFVL